MSIARTRLGSLKRALLGSTAVLLIGAAAIAAAPPPAFAQEAAKPVEETNTYYLRMMMQVFDGAEEFSHTQTAGFARMRKGDESWVAIDFGNGAVLIENANQTRVSGFKNTSPMEAGMRYDYVTKSLAGNSATATYHNTYVRPQLDKGPALGGSATWDQTLTLSELGFPVLFDQQVSIGLSREYFTHDGKPYVLLHYRAPAFSYRADGQSIVQWGEGVALTDPGFGQMYWTASLHRAVASEAGTSGRPYRYAKTMAAVDAKGIPLIDPRKIPQAAAYFERIYGGANSEIIGFVDPGAEANQTPIAISTRLDIMALSMAENSANQLGEVTSAYTSDNRGNEVPTQAAGGGGGQSGAQGGAQAGGQSDATDDAIDLGDKILGIGEALSAFANEGVQLASDMKAAQAQYAAVKAAWDALPAAEAYVTTIKSSILALENAQAKMLAELGSYSKLFEEMARLGLPPAPELIADAKRLVNEVAAVKSYIADARATGEAFEFTPSAKAEALLANLTDKFNVVNALNGKIAQYGEKGIEIAQGVKALGGKVSNLLAWVAKSPVGSVLTGLANLMNGLNIVDAVGKIAGAASTDLGSGAAPELTRDYTGNALWKTGLEMASIAANFSLGNWKSMALDIASISVGSYADVLLAMKGSADATRLAQKADWDGRQIETDAAIARMKREIQFQEDELAKVKADIKNFPEQSAETKRRIQDLLDETARRREERKKAEEEARQAFAADGKGNGPVGQPRFGDPGYQVYGTENYPKAPPATPKPPKPDPVDHEPGHDPADLPSSSTNIDPVTFNPPTWEPPKWEPPVWVPPDFHAPYPSEIAWTDFADDDWLFSADNLAYGYDAMMAGTVATDLSRWAEWLATQDVRKLERLALLAGYPNLASALADAKNIIKQSQDDGYRQWALQAPSCGGYVGCGPSYLERWWMKQSIVALGDILNDSRDVFSTGGFSDIGISSLTLKYLLRDHATEDGDIVRVRISQFGKVIYEGTVNLTNLGQLFNLGLQRGVASVEIYAVNEGALPPNTAQITVDDVVRGNATQTYSLTTGETATLRVEAGAKPGASTGNSGVGQ